MSQGIRQAHRWVSILFTLTVVANFVALGISHGQAPAWITYSPLLPLAVLVFNVLGFLVVYLLQRLQAVLPLNPEHLPAISPDGPFREVYPIRPDARDSPEADHVLDAAQAHQLVLAHRRATEHRRLDAGV